MVYKTIVKRKVEQTFDVINTGNYQFMVDGLGRDFTTVSTVVTPWADTGAPRNR